MDAQNRLIHDNTTAETTQISIKLFKHKEKVVCPYSRMLFENNKK